MVLAAGILLVAALGVFLVIGRWRTPFNRRDIPKRLGVNIQEEANGVTYTQAHAGHTLFKIHASRVIQLRNDQARLHDVQIELYGADGTSVDRITGGEFDYDQKTETATASGPVEITIMRPGEKPTTAAKSGAPGQVSAAPAANGEIRVESSGVVFHQKTGVLTTAQRVNFSTAEGAGSAIGATYDSQHGFLVLDRAVELTTRRGNLPMEIHAAHAEFERERKLQPARSRGRLSRRRSHSRAGENPLPERRFNGDASTRREAWSSPPRPAVTWPRPKAPWSSTPGTSRSTVNSRVE